MPCDNNMEVWVKILVSATCIHYFACVDILVCANCVVAYCASSDEDIDCWGLMCPFNNFSPINGRYQNCLLVFSNFHK